MPVSDKDFHEILYNHFPQLYRTEDANIQPEPYPLKRFMQIASEGFKALESEIDGMQLLFNADFMPEKYLDPIARMMGFDFPVGTTVTEKRRVIKNLPTLYKLKGNERVYGMLARLLFHKDAKTSVKWIRSENQTNLQVNLEVGDSQSSEIDGKMERFKELIEFFRPVNVGTTWNMLVFYDYLIELYGFEDKFDFTTIFMDDNLNPLGKNIAKLNSNYLLSNNLLLYGGNKIPETYNVARVTDYSVDLMNFEAMEYDIPLEVFELDHFDRVNFAVDIEDFEIYPLEDSKDTIVDYRQMLNYGIIGSTMILNQLPKITKL